jgi:hypothetical protein
MEESCEHSNPILFHIYDLTRLAAHIQLNLLSQQLPWRTEKNHEKLSQDSWSLGQGKCLDSTVCKMMNI